MVGCLCILLCICKLWYQMLYAGGARGVGVALPDLHMYHNLLLYTHGAGSGPGLKPNLEYLG